jgi:two-component system NtrC family response regulator
LILIVDDDPAVLHSLELLLKQAGFNTLGAATPAEARRHLDRAPLELVLQDMNFSRQTTGEEGLVLLNEIKSKHPDLPVILITAWGSIELAVKGMKAGAADFVTKPWQNEQVVNSVRTALNLVASGVRGGTSSCPTRAELDERYDFSGILGQDPAFLQTLDLAGRVAATDASVLITGESGTGKEEVAAAIHRNSHRREKPYVKVNLGGMSTTLFDSEMFGHVKGAFTDAQRDRTGRLASAHKGTILLDEIGELDPRSQVKLLRVLQERTYEVLGSSVTQHLDLRVISATNRDLTEAIADGSFREDLYYRINLITLHLPSLAERSRDIPLLADHFLNRAATAFAGDRRPTPIAPEALRWLQAQAWPGNVRQLAHFMARAVLVAGHNTLDVGICEQVSSMDHARSDTDALPPVGTMTVDEIEKAVIEKSLRHHAGNLSKTADSLGLSRAALYRRLEKYRIAN